MKDQVLKQKSESLNWGRVNCANFFSTIAQYTFGKSENINCSTFH